jgi:hypothetical protein
MNKERERERAREREIEREKRRTQDTAAICKVISLYRLFISLNFTKKLSKEEKFKTRRRLMKIFYK